MFNDVSGFFVPLSVPAVQTSIQQTEKLLKEYTAIAAAYDRRWSVYLGASLSMTLKVVVDLPATRVLDIACGRGFLARYLAHRYRVTAADVVIDSQLIKESPQIHFEETRLEKLPFADKAFDTVICTHTLEHVHDINTAISELRRVTGKRLIIVVPKQRPYKYTFDLHLHFFPYASNLLLLLGPGKGKYSCQELGGDWFYVEDVALSPTQYHGRK